VLGGHMVGRLPTIGKDIKSSEGRSNLNVDETAGCGKSNTKEFAQRGGGKYRMAVIDYSNQAPSKLTSSQYP
jgi:hypothetical protein